MQTKIYIANSEIDRLSKRIRKLSARVDEEGQNELKRVGLKIVAEAQKTLKKDKSIATGQLINSGKITVEDGIMAGFESDHAANVEHGQKAGTVVSPAALVQWLKKKNFTIRGARGGRVKSGKNYNGILWATATNISKKIKQKGTKAKPFLYPALRNNEKEIINILEKAIKKAL